MEGTKEVSTIGEYSLSEEILMGSESSTWRIGVGEKSLSEKEAGMNGAETIDLGISRERYWEEESGTDVGGWKKGSHEMKNGLEVVLDLDNEELRKGPLLSAKGKVVSWNTNSENL